MKRKIRLLLVDDHSLLRMGLTTLLQSEDDFEVVGEASGGREAIALAERLSPDVIIMDLMMPDISGAQATKAIHEKSPSIAILILTTFASSDEMSQAIRNGAAGALMKDVGTRDLLSVIRRLAAGEKVVPPDLLQTAQECSVAPLGEKQQEILKLVARGLSNCEIAAQFGLSEITIKKHLSAIFAKLGVSSRSEAVYMAMSKHIIEI